MVRMYTSDENLNQKATHEKTAFPLYIGYMFVIANARTGTIQTGCSVGVFKTVK